MPVNAVSKIATAVACVAILIVGTGTAASAASRHVTRGTCSVELNNGYSNVGFGSPQGPWAETSKSSGTCGSMSVYVKCNMYGSLFNTPKRYGTKYILVQVGDTDASLAGSSHLVRSSNAGDAGATYALGK